MCPWFEPRRGSQYYYDKCCRGSLFGVKLDKREGALARDNYSYKKYQKELANKKKQEEKRQSKLAKKNAQANADPERTPNEDVAS